ncbi:MAG: ferredoxin, partial [Deltaproteobacteria bacterium]
METYKITFMPDEKSVEVEPGTNLMEAADKAAIHINSLCGGEGVCGRCKVKVTNGKILADKHSISILSKEEITEGYVLACQTRVDSDMEVFIPPESRIEEAQILLEGTPVDYSEPEKIHLHRVPTDPLSLFEPLVQKIFLKLTEPSPEDNITDMDRIIRELRKRTEHRTFEIALRCLQGLASKLRENRWEITAAIAEHGDIRRILDIEPGDTTDRNYGLAVDVGTTTVVAQLVHLKSARVVGVSGSNNLQSRYGEDVISRMVFACGREKGLNPLHEAVVKNINRLIGNLTKEAGIDAQDITALVAAGNTTMSHLLLSLIPCSIRLDPYVPTVSTYPQVPARELNIEVNPEAILEV